MYFVFIIIASYVYDYVNYFYIIYLYIIVILIIPLPMYVSYRYFLAYIVLLYMINTLSSAVEHHTMFGNVRYIRINFILFYFLLNR